MRKKMVIMKTATAFFCLMLICAGAAFAQPALPKAGQTIDKSNIDTYKHLFPEEFLDAFTTGWEMIDPLVITIKDPVDNPLPQVFLDASEKNKGKYSLDPEGYIAGGPYEEIVGFPFPDISPEDDGFIEKFMWNYDYRFTLDDMEATFINYEKRRGTKATTSVIEQLVVNFQNRMFDDPKPLFKTKSGIRSVNLLNVQYPPVQKNFITLLVRYIDQKEADTTYVYLPSMRRVLRGEAGQRSTPINSSTQAPDDFEGGFSGRIPEFDYKLVGEQKMVVQGDSKLGYTEMKDGDYENLPMEKENWMVKDVYVIDILPKDEKYPQGRKRLWVDKETCAPYYAVAWDRAGALWKIWQTAVCVLDLPSGDTGPYFTGMIGLDIQIGYGVQMFADRKANGNGLKEADVSPSAMRKMAR
jgi:hypothetical protein